jgi:hypothetical protein
MEPPRRMEFAAFHHPNKRRLRVANEIGGDAMAFLSPSDVRDASVRFRVGE